MALYDLHPHQQQIVRDMVNIVEQTDRPAFVYVASSAGRSIMFEVPGAASRHVVVTSSEDLRVLAAENLVTLREGPKGPRGGSVRRSAFDAVKADFRKPADSPAGTVQNFYAPVEGVHAGAGNINIQTQQLGMSAEEVSGLLARLRGALDGVEPGNRAEAAEYLQELEEELRAPIPKQSRVKSFLLSLAKMTAGVTEFGANLAQLAQAYGVDPRFLG